MVLEVTEERVREAELIAAHDYQALRIRDWQVPKNERMQNAEDGGVFAPIPSASVTTTVSENDGFATSARQANFRLRVIPSIDVSTDARLRRLTWTAGPLKAFMRGATSR